MTSEQQLHFWEKGQSYHIKGGECCPDFSCCNPKLLAPQEVRTLFVSAVNKENSALRYRLLGEFLSKLVGTIPDKRVHIAGLEEQRREL